MATYSWALPVSGVWTTAANWSPATAPNDAAADVVIDAPTTVAGGYTVELPAGSSVTIDSLTMNGVNNRDGSNTAEYKAAILDLNGTLAFAPGSLGTIGDSLQTFIHVGSADARLINAGRIDAFLQVAGNLLMTGTNAVNFTNWVQALGTLTMDTSAFYELNGTTLFDGIFEVQGDNSLIRFGGSQGNLIANIETIVGPPLIPTGWTELIFNNPTGKIEQWDGTKYVSVERSLKQIGNRATLEVLAGFNYNTTNTLTVGTGGQIKLNTGTITAGGLVLNGGGLRGFGDIDANMVNNGSVVVVGGTIDVNGSLTGTGVLALNQGGTVGSTLEVNSVAAGQTIVMDGNDSLILQTPSAFAGTVVAQAGDRIVLQGQTVTSAVVNNGTLVFGDGITAAGRITMGGGTTGSGRFTVNGSVVTVGTTAPAPAFTMLNTTTGVETSVTPEVYTGPVAGLDWQVVQISTENLNLTATAPNSFLRSGSGMDGLNVSNVNGTNVLDGGTGSNFLIGGTGKDTFYLDNRNPADPIWSTIVNFHSGDEATVWGVNQKDFKMLTLDDVGAPGYTGLDLIFTKDGQVPVSFTIAGYRSDDLSNGRLTMTWGRTTDLPGLPGSDFLTIKGA
ncbi:MAG: hypothetical protein U1E70_05815 [Acetobacteraceae bacterium]